MPIGHRMINVMTPEHRVELLVPDTMTAAELIPEVLDLIAVDSEANAVLAGPTPQQARIGLWNLAKPGGRILPPDEPLATVDIRNGDGLLLVPDGPHFVPPRILPNLPGGGTDGSRSAWSNPSTRAVLGAVCATALGGSALLLAQSRPAGDAGRVAVIGAAFWSILSVLLGRVARPGPWRAWTAAITAASCAPLLLAVTVVLCRSGRTDGTTADIAVIMLGVTGAAWLPALTVYTPLTREVALTGSIAAAPVAVVAAIAAQTGMPLHVAAGLLVGIDSVLLHRAAALAVATHRFIGFNPATEPPPATTAWAGGPHRVLVSRTPDEAGRTAMAAVLIGLCAGLVPAWLVLSGGTGVQRWLLVASVVVAACQIRWMRFRAHRILATIITLCGAGALGILGLSAIASVTARVMVLWAVAALCLAAMAYGGRLRLPPWLLRAGEVAEVMAMVAIVPLLADELGLFALTTRLAHRWVS